MTLPSTTKEPTFESLVEESALTAEEANAIQAWIYNSLPTADMSSSSRHRNTALMKLRRISRVGSPTKG